MCSMRASAPSLPPTPRAVAMMPAWSMVWYASRRRKFFWTSTKGTEMPIDNMPNSSSRPPGKSGPSAAAGENVEANQAVERAVQHGRREDRRRRHRRFAVGVRLPGVHRREPGLGPVAEQRQDEGQPHGGLVQLRGARGQEGPVQPGQTCPSPPGVAGVVGEDGAEQRHRQARRRR